VALIVTFSPEPAFATVPTTVVPLGRNPVLVIETPVARQARRPAVSPIMSVRRNSSSGVARDP
jgi:hypothetical protein